MEIQYQIIKEKHLLVQKYVGDFSIEHYATYINILIKEPEWKYVKKILTDLREANLDLALVDLDKLIKIRDKIIRKKYLNVFLVDQPVSTAITHIYQDSLVKKEYDYKYCSTIKYALGLLELNENINEMERILKNLQNRF